MGKSGGSVLIAALIAALGSACGSSSDGGDGPATPPTTTGTETPDAGVVVTAGTPKDGGAGPAPDAGSSIAWTACGAKNGYECATVDVPLDHDDASLGTIPLAVARRRARTLDRYGVLVFNTGGPGAPVIDQLTSAPAGGFPLAAANNALLYDHFDIVAIDPRGVARSKPISCYTPSQVEALLATSPLPTDDAGWTKLFDATAPFAANCAASNDPKLLARMDTATVARDMDVVRARLGEEKLSYLGFSYGTHLGAMYATLFPTRVRAMVLDSPFAVGTDRRDRWLDMAPALDASLAKFFAWCATSSSCTFGPPAPRTADAVAAAYDALAESLDATPLTVATRPLDGAAVRLATISYLYMPIQQWKPFGDALAAAASGNGKALRDAADQLIAPTTPSANNMASVANVVSILDYTLPANVTRDDVRSFVEVTLKPLAARIGYRAAAGELAGQLTPLPAAAHAPPAVHAPTAPPILISASRYDPVCPYVDAAKLQTKLGNGSYVVTYEGAGHTQSIASPCLGMATSLFLLDPTKAPTQTSCPALTF